MRIGRIDKERLNVRTDENLRRREKTLRRVKKA